jgi:hypothetical protein
LANRMINSFTSCLIRGRPNLPELESYFAATNRRCQRRSVWGVTKLAISPSFPKVSFLAFLASRHRCSSEKGIRFLGICSRRTLTSSFKYSITACCSRFIQPDRHRRMKRNGFIADNLSN